MRKNKQTKCYSCHYIALAIHMPNAETHWLSPTFRSFPTEALNAMESKCSADKRCVNAQRTLLQ